MSLSDIDLEKRAEQSTVLSATQHDSNATKVEVAVAALNHNVNTMGAVAKLTDSSGGTAGATLAAIPDPADTPATVDALRDDLVANVLPVLRNAVASLAAKVAALIDGAAGV